MKISNKLNRYAIRYNLAFIVYNLSKAPGNFKHIAYCIIAIDFYLSSSECTRKRCVFRQYTKITFFTGNNNHGNIPYIQSLIWSNKT